MSENDFDYDDYVKGLEKILSMTEKDYWSQYIDVNRHQVNVAKTYLWVAAALLGAYAASYSQYKNAILTSGLCTISMVVISVLSAVTAFGLCLYAIPARKGYKSIAEISWGEFSEQAYVLLSEKRKNLYISVLTKLIDRVDSSTYYNVRTNEKRAKQLRITSWVLIISFSFSLISAFSLSLSNLDISITSKVKQEVIMGNDKNTTQKSGEAPQNQPATDKPDVPKPAGPIGTLPPNYTTHAEDQSKGSIRVTESLDKDGETKKE
jgi:hypothetical protein